VADEQVIGLLVGEERVGDREVVEAGGVVGEVDPFGVALVDESRQRADPIGGRVEMLNPEALESSRAPASASARR
jgi:hypothetical protein